MFDDMEKDTCPFCGKKEYVTWPGDTGDYGIQISPDMYECFYCGYEDQERCKYSEKQLFYRHKRRISKKIKLGRKWCDYMEKVLERWDR